MNLLYDWYQASQALTQLKERELTLRKQVFEQYFPEPKEGVNRTDIPGDAVLVATLPYNYTVDADAVEAGLKKVPASVREKLIVFKPSLGKAVYNALSKKARTDFTAECLSVKPGTPSLEIVVKPSE